MLSIDRAPSGNVDLSTQVFNLTCHILVGLFELANKIDSFGENLPFTGLDATVCRELIPELVEEILHFLPTLALSELVGDSELRRAGVGG